MYIYMFSDNDARETLQNEFVFYSNEPAKKDCIDSQADIEVSLTPWYITTVLPRWIRSLNNANYSWRIFFREEEYSGDFCVLTNNHNEQDLEDLKEFLLARI